jgi:hypothetical protein
MSLRAEKNHILAAEKERLVHEYERRLAADRAVLHDRLQRELAFRERNAFAGSTKPNAAYGGLLNPPKIGGDTAPKSEAFLRAKNEFKCVSEDAGMAPLHSDSYRPSLCVRYLMPLRLVSLHSTGLCSN